MWSLKQCQEMSGVEVKRTHANVLLKERNDQEITSNSCEEGGNCHTEDNDCYSRWKRISGLKGVSSENSFHLRRL